jgi:hypothetical protein
VPYIRPCSPAPLLKGEKSIMIKDVVGVKIYNVWIDMLKRLVPNGRTHRLSVVVGGMLQFTYEVASEKAESNSKARKLYDHFQAAYECSDEEYVDEIIDIVENLFKDAGVEYNRQSRRGESYSIAEEAVNEFLRWENMPWES